MKFQTTQHVAKKSFQNSCTFDMGLSDFHKMVTSVLKSTFNKQKGKFHIETAKTSTMILS